MFAAIFHDLAPYVVVVIVTICLQRLRSEVARFPESRSSHPPAFATCECDSARYRDSGNRSSARGSESPSEVRRYVAGSFRPYLFDPSDERSVRSFVRAAISSAVLLPSLFLPIGNLAAPDRYARGRSAKDLPEQPSKKRRCIFR